MKQTIFLTNSEIERAVSENIHNELYRKVLLMRLVDGKTYEQIAEAVEMTPRYLRSLVKQLTDSLKIASK